jgi:hypothetical protein
LRASLACVPTAVTHDSACGRLTRAPDAADRPTPHAAQRVASRRLPARRSAARARSESGRECVAPGAPRRTGHEAVRRLSAETEALAVRTGLTTKGRPEMRAPSVRQRLDLHNTNINFAVALGGRCGFTHLPTGRVCRLPHRHPGPCDLQSATTSWEPSRTSAGIVCPSGQPPEFRDRKPHRLALQELT